MTNENYLKKVDDLNLSNRTATCLKNENIIYIKDLLQKSEKYMLRTPNFGRKSLNEIKTVLASMELGFDMKISNYSEEITILFINIETAVKKLKEKLKEND